MYAIRSYYGIGDLACHGNPWIKTPNLDKFSEIAVRMTDFHVSPYCTPTRGAIMTGLYPINNGAWATYKGRDALSGRTPVMAEVFKQNGYTTGMFGKWHLGDNYPVRPTDCGFDVVVQHKAGGVGELSDYWGNTYFDDVYFVNNQPKQFRITSYNVCYTKLLRGLYSIPAYAGDHAAEWYGRWMYTMDDGSGNERGAGFEQRGLKTAAYHREHFGDPAVFGYKDFIPMFKAEKWSADEWADLFMEGGGKFFVFMGMHHDNFCLWDSKNQPFNSVKMGPYRDFTAEMKKAVKDRGLYFGVSNHSAWNGRFFEYNHRNGFDGIEKENQALYRITSYNVCYTKLLRNVQLLYERGCDWSAGLNEIVDTTSFGDDRLSLLKLRTIKGLAKPNPDKAMEYARQSDVIIAVMGENLSQNGEGRSRPGIRLPGDQEEFVKKLIATGKPIVLIMMSGRQEVSYNFV